MGCFGIKMLAMKTSFVAALALFSSNIGATPTTASPGEVPASRSYFYVGGSYVTTSTGTLFENQMYVEKLSPIEPSQPYPLVFIHGQAQTGTVRQISRILPTFILTVALQNWLNKPDGGAGWATYFLKQGYTIYIIDQTERARSAWNPSGNTTQTTYSAEIIEERFTAPEKFNLWPQAKLHTQWPGVGSQSFLSNLI
jgi:hypothetical protein